MLIVANEEGRLMRFTMERCDRLLLILIAAIKAPPIASSSSPGRTEDEIRGLKLRPVLVAADGTAQGRSGQGLVIARR